MRKFWALGFLSLFFFNTTKVLAWGERGHRVIGSCSAYLAALLETARTPESESFRRFFNNREGALGHASNLPDISWRSFGPASIAAKVSSSTHFLNAEELVGAQDGVSERVRNLPASYEEFRLKYEGKNSALTGKPLSVFENGTAPWRSQELYGLMVSALGSFKAKQTTVSDKVGLGSEIRLPFRLVDESEVKSATDLLLPTFKGEPSENRFDDLSAALTLAGILGHFVEDGTQPFHGSSNHDGWQTGNGGLHSYFEDRIVDALDLHMPAEVLEMASDAKFQKSVWSRMRLTQADAKALMKSKDGVAKMMLLVTAEALDHQAEITRLDSQLAVTTPGDVVPWGQSSRGAKSAKRRPAEDFEILKAFRPIVVERLATGVVVLASLWQSAWEQAGRPNFDFMNPETKRRVYILYPMDSPFIWPSYDLPALDRIIKGLKPKQE